MIQSGITGRTSLIRIGVFLLAFAAAALPLSPAGAEVDFLVPGVSLGSVDFTAGTFVSYLIISEAHGIRDTSSVSLTVTGASLEGADLEITSTTWPPVEDETVTVRLSLCADARSMKVPEDFYACVRDVRVKSGSEPFREPSLEELEDFDISRMFLKRKEGLRRSELDSEQVETPAGSFDCDVYEYLRSDRRDVDMGGVTAQRSEEERSILRISQGVPFWGLVRSRVERTSRISYRGGSRPRDSRPKITVTESVLIDFSTPGRNSGE